MKKILFPLLAAAMLTACTHQTAQTEKDMHQLSFNEQQAACMTAIAANEAKGGASPDGTGEAASAKGGLYFAIEEGLEADLTVSQIKEALSHLYAYTGFPRSLNALGTLQRVIGDRQAKGAKVLMGEEPSPLPDDYDALKQGTAVQTELTGRVFNYDFAPATDYYLKAHLFGDIFARDNLTYADRELVTVSALSAMQGVEPQLAAHINGARNMGVTEEQLQGIVVALATQVGFEEAGRLAKIYDDLSKQELSTSNSETSFNSQLSTFNFLWPQGQPNEKYAQFFVGQSHLHPYAGISNVTFEPRCRNNWHIHHGAVQVLICVSGKGWYQEWGKPAVPLTPGTVIAIPEGVKHWHGAATDSWMQHLALHTQEHPEASNEWLEPVSDEQYNQVK